MDGNGRWAKKRFMPRTVGHRQGAEALRAIIKACSELGIQHLSVYAFSTENWKRPPEEVQFLMGFLKEMLTRETPKLHKQQVKIKILGDVAALPPALQDQILKSETQTATNPGLQFNLLINYGARHEITQGIQAIVAAVQQGQLDPTSITDTTLSDYLYSRNIPDPDMLIRSGGDVRISNFLLWQCAYSELFFIDTLWPDFDRSQLIALIQAFQKRDRRFGGVNA